MKSKVESRLKFIYIDGNGINLLIFLSALKQYKEFDKFLNEWTYNFFLEKIRLQSDF